MNWIFFLENCTNTQSNSIQFLYHFLKIVKKICVCLSSLNQFNTAACFIALIHLSINSFIADKQNLRINRKQAALHKILYFLSFFRQELQFLSCVSDHFYCYRLSFIVKYLRWLYLVEIFLLLQIKNDDFSIMCRCRCIGFSEEQCYCSFPQGGSPPEMGPGLCQIE